MKLEDIQKFEGYAQVAAEAATCGKYGIDYHNYRGVVEQQIARLHPPSMSLRVSEIIEETRTAKTLRLTSPAGYLPPFQAGQYIALHLNIGKIRTSRPYSISSPPNQTGYYDLTVRRVDGGLCSGYLLDEIRAGDFLEASGPAGLFHHNPLIHGREVVYLAGGSGVTPFMSMIREALQCGFDRNMTLFYGNPTLEDVIFHDELVSLAKRFENFRYAPVIEKPPTGSSCAAGFMTGSVIGEALGDLMGKTFFLCGPQGMYNFCIPELERLGIPGKLIRQEVFGAPAKAWESSGWPAAVLPEQTFNISVRGGKSFSAPAGETLLASMEKNGLAVASLCRSGECSLCRIKVLSGKVFQPTGVKLRESDRRYGYVHSCISYPLEDLELILF